MGKIVDNRITSSFSGQLSEDVVFRQIGNKAFFARKGVNTKPPTAAQRGNRACLQRHKIMPSECWISLSTVSSIVAKVNGLRSAQIAAVKDFMSKPEIDSINTQSYRGTVGDVILMKPKMLLKFR